MAVSFFSDGMRVAVSLLTSDGHAVYWQPDPSDNNTILLNLAGGAPPSFFVVSVDPGTGRVAFRSESTNAWLSVISNYNQLYIWAVKPQPDEWCWFSVSGSPMAFSLSNAACGNLSLQAVSVNNRLLLMPTGNAVDSWKTFAFAQAPAPNPPQPQPAPPPAPAPTPAPSPAPTPSPSLPDTIVFTVQPPASGSGFQPQAGLLPILGPTTHSLCVGEYAAVRVQAVVNTTVTSVTWTITGNPIGGYNENTGTIVPFVPTTAVRQAWFWTAPGVYTVRMDAVGTLNGVPETGTKTMTVTVKAPTFAGRVQSRGAVTVIAGTPPMLSYGTTANTAPGVVFGGDFTMFADAADLRFPGGTVRFTQLVNETDTVTTALGAIGRFATNGDWLDTQPSYANADRQWIGVSPTKELITTDTPRSTLPAQSTLRTIDLAFKVYARFRSGPPGSIFVTVARATWSVRMTAQYAANSWSVVAAQCSHAESDFAASSEMCVWNGNVLGPATVRQYVPVQPPPPPPQPVPPPPTNVPPVTGNQTAIIRQSQNDTQVIFQYLLGPWVRGAPTYTTGDTIAAIGRQFGPTMTYNGVTYYQIWAPLDDVSGAPGVFQPQELPNAARRGDLSSASAPTYSIMVAPFCYANDPYWTKFAHSPVASSNSYLADPIDYSFDGYQGALMGLISMCSGSIIAAGNGNVWIKFTSTPPQSVIDAIVAMKQTQHIRRVPDSENRIMPGPGPSSHNI